MTKGGNNWKVIRQYVLSAAVIGGVALLCAPLANTRTYHLVSFILLFVVSILSTFLGLGPVLLASTMSALVWNYFFIPPHHTFHIEKADDLLIFGLFFTIALVSGVLSTRVRRQERISREREKRTNALFQLTRELSKAGGMKEVLKVAAAEIRNHFGDEPVFLLQDGNNQLQGDEWSANGQQLTRQEKERGVRVFREGRKSGSGEIQSTTERYTFYPLGGTRISPGVIALKSSPPLTPEQESFREAFLTQVSNALEREFLGEMAQKVRFLDESDRLYKTLFNSISHELRIPIATIMGASDSILNARNSDEIHLALVREIFTASLRLNRLIENLLNISRLESGHFSVRTDWCDINDLVNKVTDELKDELKPFSLEVSVPEDMPLVKIDFGLLEHVLYNLLFNATQYAPGASVIGIRATYQDGRLLLEVRDRGPGFPEHQIREVFKKFFRGDGSRPGGLGLGLSIAKGFVEAHGGAIQVANAPGGGARFILSIPSETPDIFNM
jgi:two-component system sensor histidine kinase KdpD